MDYENAKYFGSFPISDELYAKTMEYLDYIYENSEEPGSRSKLTEIVNELTTEGVDYFFHYSIKIIGMNIIARNAVGVGLAGIKTTVKTLSRKFIKNFDSK